MAEIAIAGEIGRRRHAWRRLTGRDFEPDAAASVFTLDLVLERETEEVEFQTRSTGGPAFSLSKVVVRDRPTS